MDKHICSLALVHMVSGHVAACAKVMKIHMLAELWMLHDNKLQYKSWGCHMLNQFVAPEAHQSKWLCLYMVRRCHVGCCPELTWRASDIPVAAAIDPAMPKETGPRSIHTLPDTSELHPLGLETATLQLQPSALLSLMQDTH